MDNNYYKEYIDDNKIDDFSNSNYNNSNNFGKKEINKKNIIIALILILLIVGLVIFYFSYIKKSEKSKGNDINNDGQVVSAETKLVFEKTNYICKIGEEIQVNVQYSFANDEVNIKSYESTDNSIARIESFELNQNDEVYILAVKCLKEGSVDLTINTSDEVETKTGITVEKQEVSNTIPEDSGSNSLPTTEPDTGKESENDVSQQPTVQPEESKSTIKYENDKYTCIEGGKFTTKILVEETSIKSYESSDTKIATITSYEPSDDIAIKLCKNCKYVEVNCLKTGSISLIATSTDGVKTTSKLEVQQKIEIDEISYDKSSYTCKVGENITAIITANSSKDENVRVKTFESSDTSIATIKKHPNIVSKSLNSTNVQIKCLSEGEVVLTAISSTGAKTTSKLIVEDDKKDLDDLLDEFEDGALGGGGGFLDDVRRIIKKILTKFFD